MAIETESTYRPPWWLSNGHLQTWVPTLLRRVRGVTYRRERIITPDDDFLDLDWAQNQSERLAVLSHGLEGDSNRPYVVGMVRALARAGWDALAWNARGCSGEPNRQLRFTHSGATEDLETVIRHATKNSSYSQIALIGFSLGGNLTLKYLGERDENLDFRIKAAVVFSVPCDLLSASVQLATRTNRIYMRRFLATLRHKVRAMMQLAPGEVDDRDYELLRTFRDFDDRYTAPIHGFKDAEDYWRQCSSKPFLTKIRVPTLLVNARNDPFLAAPCFPLTEAQGNCYFHLEMPNAGGHVGFPTFNNGGQYWSEDRALRFLREVT